MKLNFNQAVAVVNSIDGLSEDNKIELVTQLTSGESCAGWSNDVEVILDCIQSVESIEEAKCNITELMETLSKVANAL